MVKKTNNSQVPAPKDDYALGLVYAHNRVNTKTAELHQSCATIEAIGNLLIEHGILDRNEIKICQNEEAEK